jgi:hypothetical protein
VQEIDEKPLRCGRHYCDKVCHEGLCGPCKFLIKASCFCGEKEEMILRGDMEIQGEIDWKNGVFMDVVITGSGKLLLTYQWMDQMWSRSLPWADING